jgi:hypothetical protein
MSFVQFSSNCHNITTGIYVQHSVLAPLILIFLSASALNSLLRMLASKGDKM